MERTRAPRRLSRRRAGAPVLARPSRSAPAAPPALDLPLVVALLTLACLGVLNLTALGESGLATHQAFIDLVGVGCGVAAWRVRRDRWTWIGRGVYVVAVLMLVAVEVHGVRAFGAKRWLVVGSFVLQPSEVAELGLLLVLAEVGSHPHLGSARRVVLALGLTALPVGLTLLEPDLSTTMLLLVICGATLVLARVDWRWLAGLALGALAAVPLGLHLLRPYQLARLHGFLGGGGSGAASWTELQAHVAIAAGGLLGTARSPRHALLAAYLPARETDLAFASLIEEWGLVAAVVLLAAVAVVLWRLVRVASHARTQQGALIAGGLAALVGTETAISIAGNLGVGPLAGIPIPLLSYGGTAAVAHLTAFGLVLGARSDAQQRRLWRLPGRLRERPRLVRGVAGGLAVLLVALGVVTVRLQAVHGPSLRQTAIQEMTRYVVLTPPRGEITDRHGVVLARDVPVDAVLGIPGILLSGTRAFARLAGLLHRTRASLRRALAAPAPGGGFAVTLAPSVASGLGNRVAAAAIPGVLVVASQRQTYPYGSLLGPILGFTGVETPGDVHRLGLLPPGSLVGRAGLQLEYDTTLRGRAGSQAVLVNPAGVPIALGPSVAPRSGRAIRLSLDLGLQEVATRALRQAIDGSFPGSQTGDEGAAVVLDARTGQVLAMASLPGYNDNLFGPPVDGAQLQQILQAPGSPLLEHATQTALPPGSTFKLVVAGADVRDRAIPPQVVIPTGYSFAYDGQTYHSWTTLPAQNLAQAIAWSNDVYFYKLAVALGPQRIVPVAHALGVGQTTGLDLPGESPGFLGSPATVTRLGATWYPGSTVILGIGQGYVTATPLQVARWTAAVATGQMVVPRLGLAVRSGRGWRALPHPPARRLGFADQLGPVRQGLRLAVTQGTASMLHGLGVDAGGKTGTAQDPAAPHGGPDAWFTAVAPMRNPQVVVTVMVHGGGEGYYASQPATREILQYFFHHERQILATTPSPSPPAAGPPPRGHAAGRGSTAARATVPAPRPGMAAGGAGPCSGVPASRCHRRRGIA
ncbi:MAG TPA: FtsW/RodA/SpoVE family cell cycle protein [Verrucomicrobiae bacterium]|nr:FtsW/RodA/SpoVE family cell cycle protein [Verrucomicrobiae bacterium]